MRDNSRKKLFGLLKITAFALLSAFVIYMADKNKAEVKKQAEALDLATEEEDEGEKTLELWYSYKKYEPYLTLAAEEFEKETGITVRLNYYNSIDYLDKIKNRTVEGNGPDLYVMSEDAMQNAVLLGIARQNEDDGLYSEENFTSKSLESIQYVGKKYGYPLGFETSVFAVNMDYVDELPKTFDEVKSFSDSLGDEDGDSDSADDGESSETDADLSKVSSILKWDVSDVFYSYGFLGAYLNLGGQYGDDPEIIDVLGSEAVSAAEYFYSLSEYFFIDSKTTDYDSVINEFINGNIIFTIASADILDVIRENDVNVALEVLPDLSDELKSKALSVTDIVMVNPYSGLSQEAVQFARFLTSDFAGNMYESCGIIAAKKVEYEDENIGVFVDAYEASVGMPKLMTTSDYWLRVKTVTSGVWDGEGVQELLENLYDELNSRIN